MKIIFLIGDETPMDLLLLSMFLRDTPIPELMVGIRRAPLWDKKKIRMVCKTARRSGLGIIIFNMFLNSSFCSRFLSAHTHLCRGIYGLSKKYKFPFFFFYDVNHHNTLSQIRDYSPHIIFNHMPQRIRLALIKIPPLGIINIHPGLLPEYQGMGSCLWPLIYEDSHHGATLHYIDSEEIDKGPIVTIGRLPLHKKDTVLSLNVKNRIIAARLASYITQRLCKNDKVNTRTQAGGTYNILPTKALIQSMKKKGHSYISGIDRNILNQDWVSRVELMDETTGWQWRPWRVD